MFRPMAIWEDLFTSYRRYKWMDVDYPQYEPLENEVMSKEEIKKLKAKEYNEKNKDKNKIKRLEKLVAELRQQIKEQKDNENVVIGNFAWLDVKVADEETILKSRVEMLENELDQRERDFDEFKAAVKVIMKYL